MCTKIFLRLTNPKLYDKLIREPLLTSCATACFPRVQINEVSYDNSNKSLTQAGVHYQVCRQTASGVIKEKIAVNQIIKSVLKPFRQSDAGKRLHKISSDSDQLRALFKCSFERHRFDLSLSGGSLVEFMADKGQLIAGKRRQSFVEISLRHKSGSVAAMFNLAAVLSQNYPLILTERDKSVQGLRLINLAYGMPPDDTIRRLTSRDDASVSLRKILLFYMKLVIKAQREFLDQAVNPESLHQLRVKVRQLRSILSFGKPLIDPVTYNDQQSALRSVGAALSYVRELDVLAEEWDQVLVNNKNYQRYLPRFSELLEGQRSSHRKILLVKMRQGQFTPILLNLWSKLLAERGKTGQATLTAADYTRRRLAAWLKKFHKTWKSTNLDNEFALHALRIKGKKLRYVLESIALHTKWDNKSLRSRLKELQDNLGLLHDTYRYTVLIPELIVNSASVELHYEAGILLGWQLQRAALVYQKLQDLQQIKSDRKK